MFFFPKKQKLCCNKAIARLFDNADSIVEYPIRILWKLESNEEDVSVKVLISVPKKRLKMANDRNLVKRRIRNAYRIKNKTLELFLQKKKIQLNLGIIYNSAEIFNYSVIEQKINLLLMRLVKRI